MEVKQHRCFGLNKNLRRCGRYGHWRLFCSEHQRQPFTWLFTLLFTVGAALATYYSALVPISPPQGVSAERFVTLAKELGVTQAALKSFFKILEQHLVPPEDLDSKLREIAKSYNNLQDKLSRLGQADSKIIQLKGEAKEALDAGNFASADALLQQAKSRELAAIAEQEAVLRQHQLSAAGTAVELADLKNTELNYSKAALYYREASNLVPKDMPETQAFYLNQEGTAWLNAGVYAEAQRPLETALALREATLDSQHPDIVVSLNNLAMLYKTQGLYQQAQLLFERALDINKKSLGFNHPNIALYINNLAGIYQEQGLHDQAEPLYLRALAIVRAVFGFQHPHVITGLNNLAGVYKNQGRFDEAQPLYELAVTLGERVFGPEHPKVATYLNNLGLLYQTQGLYNQAESLYLRALDIDEKRLGPEHPNVATDLGNLAGLYQAQGCLHQAESYYLRALEIDEKRQIPDLPNMAIRLHNLALLYQTQGLNDQAEDFYQKALSMTTNILGHKHPTTQTIRLNGLNMEHGQ